MGEGTTAHPETPEAEGNAEQSSTRNPIHLLFWLWVGLCLLYALLIAPVGCLNSCMASLADALRDQEIKCLTGAIIGIPIGFFNGLSLLICGIIIRRTKQPIKRLGAWIFILVSMVIYLPPTTSGLFLGWPFDEYWTVALTTLIHHGLLTVLILMLWRISKLASAADLMTEISPQNVNTNQQL